MLGYGNGLRYTKVLIFYRPARYLIEVGILRAWGTCLDCNYEGILEYSRVEGESYTDEDALGLIMLLHCTACGSSEHTLVTMEYYLEISAGDDLSE